MSHRTPTISVGMPVYNGERYLMQAIECVLAQTFGDFELLISDNASTDTTEAICRDHAARDARITYIRNATNIGAARNYNQLFERSQGRYFRWFNADDLSKPTLHQRCLDALLAQPDASVAYGKTEKVDGTGRLIAVYEDRLDLRQDSAAERFFEALRVVGLINVHYGLMRREAVRRTSLMGSGTFPAADVNLVIELALQGKIIEIPEVLFYRRIHDEAFSGGRTDVTAHTQFWLGRDVPFVMPTFKKFLAYWRAIERAPASRSDKRAMKRHMLRRLLWARSDLMREALAVLPRATSLGRGVQR